MSEMRPILPPSAEVPVQMSPFSDERWEIDIQENKRRKEIQRDYAYNYKRPVQPLEVIQENVKSYPETVPLPPKEPETAPPILEQVQPPETEKDYFKFEPTQTVKPWSELSFQTPAPPDLYPVLKFPERRIRPEEVYNPAPKNHLYVLPGATTTPDPPPAPDMPPRPQFAVFKDIKPETPKVEHYGVYVPFWQFSTKG